ncbi:MAG: PilZ domain-containing protein [Smithella sp.]
MESNIKKIYVDANGLVTLICPNCDLVQKEQAQVYMGTKGPVKIQCKCGNIYDVEIEFRGLFRKEIGLDGIYLTVSNPKNWGKMIVKNLSIQGCKFETLTANLLNPDEEINIEFYLNNAKNSLIKKSAVVRYVNKKYIGCEFKKLPGAFDPDLGFYLMKL